MNLLRIFFKSDLRIFGAVFGVIFLVAVVDTVRRPRMYQASGVLRLYRLPTENVVAKDSLPHSVENLIEIQPTLKSAAFAQRIARRMGNADRTAFLKPYAHLTDEADDALIERLLRENQECSVHPAKMTLRIQYLHPDRQVCARVTNLFIDEYITYQMRRRIDGAIQAVEELKLRVGYQEKTVRDVTDEMAAYRERSEKNTKTAFVADEGLELLQNRQAREKEFLDLLLRLMSEITMPTGAKEEGGWLVAERAVAPDERDYLIVPLARRLAWGFAAAVVGGFLSVGAVRCFFFRSRTDDGDADLTNF